MKKRDAVVIKPEPEDAVLDERDTHHLLRSVVVGAFSGGLTFIRAKMGDAEFARALSRVRLREPIVRLIGPPAHSVAMNDQQAPTTDAPHVPIVATPVAPPADSKYLDEKQLCSELSISSVTATKWRGKAEGPPFVRVGRLIRYPREAFNAWLASRTVGTPRR